MGENFPLAIPARLGKAPLMKSFLLLLVTLLVLVAVVGGGGAIYYLSKTSEITRVEKTPPPSAPVPGE